MIKKDRQPMVPLTQGDREYLQQSIESHKGSLTSLREKKRLYISPSDVPAQLNLDIQTLESVIKIRQRELRAGKWRKPQSMTDRLQVTYETPQPVMFPADFAG